MGCPYKTKHEGIDYCEKADSYISLLPDCTDNSQICGYKSEKQIRKEEYDAREVDIQRLKAEQQRQEDEEMYQGMYGLLINKLDTDYEVTWKDVAVRILLLVSCLYYLKTGYGVFVITIGMAMVFAIQAALVLLAFVGMEHEIDKKLILGAFCVTGLGWILTIFGLIRNWSFRFLLSFIIAYFYPVILFYGVIWLIKRLRDSH